jgi:preprotein translocase subunit SecE
MSPPPDRGAGGGRITMRERWEQLVRFLKEVRMEMKKVNWPPKKEVVGSTIVVIVSVFILSFFLGIVDVTLQKLITYVLR